MGQSKDCLQFKLIMMIKYFLLFLLSVNSFAQEVDDTLGLSAMLIQGQSFEKAITLLDKFEPINLKEEQRLSVLKGLAKLGQRNFDSAIQSFEKALTFKEPSNEIILYLAKAYTGSKNYQKVIDLLSSKLESSESYRVLVNAFWSLNRPNQALSVLNFGLQNFKTEESLYKQKLFYLFELKLYQEGISFFENKYATSFPLSGQDYVDLATAIQDPIYNQLSLQWLEKAKLLFPKDEQVLLALGRVYFGRGSYYNAAVLFDQLAHINSKYFSEASELYRRSGHLITAISLNNEVPDFKQKLEQRFVLFLDNQDVEKMTSMQSQMEIHGILENDELRYAMAWAQFEKGNYGQAQRMLAKIIDQKIFEKAQDLRKQIVDCQQENFKCVF